MKTVAAAFCRVCSVEYPFAMRPFSDDDDEEEVVLLLDAMGIDC